MVRSDGGRLFQTSGPQTANARQKGCVRYNRSVNGNIWRRRGMLLKQTANFRSRINLYFTHSTLTVNSPQIIKFTRITVSESAPSLLAYLAALPLLLLS